MIIERQYVPFCMLFHNDKEAWDIFEKAFNESYREEDRGRIWEMLSTQCLYEREMGWCFSKLLDVIEGFERLDKERPYDNGFSYKDVNETRIFSSGKNGLVIQLICRFDGIYNTVKFIKLQD